jgi:ribosomal-protein-alanine N-acetyltransferase
LTDGVIALRPWQSRDAEWYVAQIADADIQRFTAEPPELAPEAVRGAIEDMQASQAHAGLAITDAATGTLVGNAGLARDEPGVGNISCWVAHDARGHGAATRAVKFLVNWLGTAGCAGFSCTRG